MSLWRLAALVLHLPPDSATARRHSTDADRWTQDHELAAATVEAIDAASLRLASLWTKRGARLPDPVHIPRPYDRRPKVTSMSDPRARAFFGAAVRYVPTAPTDDL